MAHVAFDQAVEEKVKTLKGFASKPYALSQLYDWVLNGTVSREQFAQILQLYFGDSSRIFKF